MNCKDYKLKIEGNKFAFRSIFCFIVTFFSYFTQTFLILMINSVNNITIREKVLPIVIKGMLIIFFLSSFAIYINALLSFMNKEKKCFLTIMPMLSLPVLIFLGPVITFTIFGAVRYLLLK